jgi:hypothetical protein
MLSIENILQQSKIILLDQFYLYGKQYRILYAALIICEYVMRDYNKNTLNFLAPGADSEKIFGRG